MQEFLKSARQSLPSTAFAILILLTINSARAEDDDKPKSPPFQGRQVTIAEPKLENKTTPKGPASICVEAPPQRQCYSFENKIGRKPSADVVQLDKNTTALYFSAESGGTSDVKVRLSLLRPGPGKDLQDIFPHIEVSNHNQHAFWPEPLLSDRTIFLIADAVLGPDESADDPHRYTISMYVAQPRRENPNSINYVLLDQYRTVRTYDVDDDDINTQVINTDILSSESGEIFRRLMSVLDYQKQKDH